MAFGFTGYSGLDQLGNEITRITTWARLVEKATGRALWHFNTHFDHVSQSSREKSAELLAHRIANRSTEDPVIVTGDFNAGEKCGRIISHTLHAVPNSV